MELFDNTLDLFSQPYYHLKKQTILINQEKNNLIST